MYDKKTNGVSRVDGMRRCNYELSRVMGMRRWLTVMNATAWVVLKYASVRWQGCNSLVVYRVRWRNRVIIRYTLVVYNTQL